MDDLSIVDLAGHGFEFDLSRTSHTISLTSDSTVWVDSTSKFKSMTSQVYLGVTIEERSTISLSIETPRNGSEVFFLLVTVSNLSWSSNWDLNTWHAIDRVFGRYAAPNHKPCPLNPPDPSRNEWGINCLVMVSSLNLQSIHCRIPKHKNSQWNVEFDLTGHGFEFEIDVEFKLFLWTDERRMTDFC